MVCKSRSPPRLNRKLVVPSFLVNSSAAVLVKMFPVLFRFTSSAYGRYFSLRFYSVFVFLYLIIGFLFFEIARVSGDNW